MSAPEHRASDAEREAAAGRLRDAAGEGRLTADELDERVGRVYAARTIGELEAVTADLPAPAQVVEVVAPPSALDHPQVRRRLAKFLTANVICIAVWLATGASGGFWPVWVLLGTGIALVTSVVHAWLGVAPEEKEPRRRVGPPRPPAIGRRR